MPSFGAFQNVRVPLVQGWLQERIVAATGQADPALDPLELPAPDGEDRGPPDLLVHGLAQLGRELRQ